MLGPIPVDDPFAPPPLGPATLRNPTNGRALERWREHQRRQRSLRFLLMFLMMLILMDGEDPNNRQIRHKDREAKYLRHARNGSSGSTSSSSTTGTGGLPLLNGEEYLRGEDVFDLTPELYEARRMLDNNLHRNLVVHPRFKKLVEKNNGADVENNVEKWVDTILSKPQDDEKTKEATVAPKVNDKESSDGHSTNDEKKSNLVYHYPRNATGYYRGRWNRFQNDGKGVIQVKGSEDDTTSENKHKSELQSLGSEEVMKYAQRRDNGATDGIGLVFLSNEEKERILGNTTSHDPDETSAPEILNESSKHQTISITRDSGRIILHLYLREVPGMKEISLVDGFIKICDVSNSGFSSPKRHIFLRVRGVILHSIGRISLVANDDVLHASALTIMNEDGLIDEKKGKQKKKRNLHNDSDGHHHSASDQRLLQKSISDTIIDHSNSSDTIQEVRDNALKLYSDSWDEHEVGGENWNNRFSVPEDNHTSTDSFKTQNRIFQSTRSRHLSESSDNEVSSLTVLHPYAPDDEKQSLQKIPSAITKGSPPEALLEYSKHCEFEINIDIKDTKLETKQWRRLAEKVRQRIISLDPTRNETITAQTNISALVGAEEALISNLVGLIVSPNCDISMMINVTAIRTDWEQMTCKAINYCFFMMLASLTQIVVLLRQLLHTQAQSSAVRVSIICIGWQGLLDAILCITHILFCIMLQPVFSAFAMVAFFKLLIFCVIEMKYMVIIMQARNNARNVPQSTEEIRRKVGMLHLRFYGTLILLLFLAFRFGQYHRTPCMLLMYSFWLPQIIRNIITETKKPMHKYYIYGMSVTRLIAPLYMFSIPRNFLKEIDPEFPADTFTCQMLVLWMCVQVVVLISQEKYGARFMIPNRFLPPKYDYHRPVPDSLLPKPSTQNPSSLENSTNTPLLSNDGSPGESSVGPRNRKEKRSTRAAVDESSGSTTVDTTIQTKCLDCVICYTEIDITNRESYMLAPCGHIFHRECLEQWMEVKMECPICRMELPPL